MINVLSVDATSESGRRLAEALHGQYHTALGQCRIGPRNVMIRWGHSGGTDPENTLNKAAAVRLNCDKREAMTVMGDVVDVPRIFARMIPAGRKAVVRTLEHAHGVGFRVVDGPSQIPAGQFGAEFIETSHEYRVWFVGNRMRAAKRVAVRPEDRGVCRSNWGYEVRDLTENQRRVVAAARDAIGLDFGAADILWVESRGCYVVLELNTAPSLDTPGVLDFFTRNMTTLIRERFPNAMERRMAERRQADRRRA